jgi:hypothetical protein
MYIKNIENIPEKKVYTCNGLIASYLIYQKHMPLLSRKEKTWYFYKTSKLEKALKEMPFWYKVACKF